MGGRGTPTESLLLCTPSHCDVAVARCLAGRGGRDGALGSFVDYDMGSEQPIGPEGVATLAAAFRFRAGLQSITYAHGCWTTGLRQSVLTQGRVGSDVRPRRSRQVGAHKDGGARCLEYRGRSCRLYLAHQCVVCTHVPWSSWFARPRGPGKFKSANNIAGPLRARPGSAVTPLGWVVTSLKNNKMGAQGCAAILRAIKTCPTLRSIKYASAWTPRLRSLAAAAYSHGSSNMVSDALRPQPDRKRSRRLGRRSYHGCACRMRPTASVRVGGRTIFGRSLRPCVSQASMCIRKPGQLTGASRLRDFGLTTWRVIV